MIKISFTWKDEGEYSNNVHTFLLFENGDSTDTMNFFELIKIFYHTLLYHFIFSINRFILQYGILLLNNISTN